MNEKSFYYWQRKIPEEAYENQAVSKPVNYEVGFAQIPALPKVQESITTSDSAKILVNGSTNEIVDSASDEFLHRLLGALSYVP